MKEDITMAVKRKASLTEEKRRESTLTDDTQVDDGSIPEPEVDPGQEGLIGEPSEEQKEQAPNPTPKPSQDTNVPEEHVAFQAGDVVLPDHTFVGPVVTGHKPQPISDAEMENAETTDDDVTEFEHEDGRTTKMALGRYHIEKQ
jgi:hypothetical protein